VKAAPTKGPSQMSNGVGSRSQWRLQLLLWSPSIVSIVVTRAMGMSFLERLLITCGVGVIAVPVAYALSPASKLAKSDEDTPT